MKKLIIAAVLLFIAAVAAFIVYQNRPMKRIANNIIQARIMTRKGNLEQARAYYKAAYDIKDKYTPYADFEVMQLENTIKIRDNDFEGAIDNTKRFLEKSPKNKEAKLILSQLAFSSGDLSLAFDQVHEVLKTEPANFKARLILANVRSKMGRLDLAERQLRILYEKYPDSLNSLMPLASNMLLQGKFKECKQFLAKVLKQSPNEKKALLLLTDVYLKENNVDSAAQVLDNLAESDNTIARMVHVRKAKLLSNNGKIPEAIELLGQYNQLDQENLPALFETALLNVLSGDTGSAIELYKSIGDEFPNAEYRCKLLSHLIHLGRGNYAKSLKLLKEIQVTQGKASHALSLIMNYIAMGLDHRIGEYLNSLPDSLQKTAVEFQKQIIDEKEFIHQWAMLSYYRLNYSFKQLIGQTRDMYQKWPNSQYIANMYTAQLISMRNLKKALGILEKQKQPTLSQKIKMVQIYLYFKKTAKAVKMAKDIQKKHPYVKGIHLMLADHYRKFSRKKYVYHLQKELEISPHNQASLNNLIWEYGVTRKDFTKALPYIQRLEEKKLTDPRILDTIGWVYAIHKNYRKAEPYLNLSLILVPDNPDFLYHVGWLQYHLGNSQKASGLLKKSMQSGLMGKDKVAAQHILAGLK